MASWSGDILSGFRCSVRKWLRVEAVLPVFAGTVFVVFPVIGIRPGSLFRGPRWIVIFPCGTVLAGTNVIRQG